MDDEDFLDARKSKFSSIDYNQNIEDIENKS